MDRQVGQCREERERASNNVLLDIIANALRQIELGAHLVRLMKSLLESSIIFDKLGDTSTARYTKIIPYKVDFSLHSFVVTLLTRYTQTKQRELQGVSIR